MHGDTTFDNGDHRSTFEFNDAGIRVGAVEEDHDGTPTPEAHDFHIDANNPTGYAQVIEEIVEGQLVKSFTIGHDVISQTVGSERST